MTSRNYLRMAAAVICAAAIPTVAWATPLDGLDAPNNGQSSEHRQDDFVDVCHFTDEHSAHPYITVQVDGDAWDEHTSAHSAHELDFLVDEEHPCPPVTPDPDPTPPRLTQWCFPAVNLGEVVLELDGGGEATLVDDSAYVLLTFEPSDDNLHLVGALGGLEPDDDQTPCPLRDTPPPVVTPTPPVEVGGVTIIRPAPELEAAIAALPAEVSAGDVVQETGALPFTGLEDWLAPLAALLLAAGALFLKTARRA